MQPSVMCRKAFSILASTLVLLSFLSSSATAELLSYTDKSGKQYYVDSVEKIPPEYRNQTNSAKPLPPISKVNPGREKLYEKEKYPEAPKGQRGSLKGEITVFVTDWCPHCRNLEAQLSELGIKYRRMNIDKDKQAMAAYRQLGGGGVPMTVINGDQVIRGADIGAIRDALKNPRKQSVFSLGLTPS